MAEVSQLSGLVQFSVDGHAVKRLRIPLAQDSGTPVHVRFEPGPPKPLPETHQPDDQQEEAPNEEVLNLSAEHVNAIGPPGQSQVEADQLNDDTYVLRGTSPGAYWIEASANRPGTCLGTVTSGGEDLARAPWTAGVNGAGAPIDVVVRTDCAKLTVGLPPMAKSAGEEQSIFVYAVPEFDSMEGIVQADPAEPHLGERSVEIPNMPPGAYRLYAFHSQRSIEFRNPEALERLGAGQEVSLEPNGSANVMVEVANE
jgi:hypothetical protein